MGAKTPLHCGRSRHTFPFTVLACKRKPYGFDTSRSSRNRPCASLADGRIAFSPPTFKGPLRGEAEPLGLSKLLASGSLPSVVLATVESLLSGRSGWDCQGPITGGHRRFPGRCVV